MFKYVPTPTGIKFHGSNKFLKGITGPFGSGKSCIIAEDILMYGCEQAPAADNVRYTRWGIIRSTYPELMSTTRNSILEVMPVEFGTIKLAGAPITGLWRFPLPDGTVVQMEFVLQALQTAEDAEKVKSANWTGAWLNETTGIASEVLAAVMGRVGRFPPENLGGCSWAGVLLDFNQPPHGHYLGTMMESPEDNWEFFKQPPAAFKHVDDMGVVTYEVNTEAENLQNLKGGVEYYSNQIAAWKQQGRTDMIDSLFCLEDVPMKDGKPVYSEFNYDMHVSRTELVPIQYTDIVVGYDTSGIHPAAVILQLQQGRWAILDELYGDEMGMETFIDQLLIPTLHTKYANCEAIVSCDPANAREGFKGLAPTEHLKNAGLRVVTPSTNDPKTRIRAVSTLLNRNFGGLIISPNCTLTIRAMQGGYRYKKLRAFGSITEAFSNAPEKNLYSHIADAIQYGVLQILKGDTYDDAHLRNTRRRLDKRRKTLKRIM